MSMLVNLIDVEGARKSERGMLPSPLADTLTSALQCSCAAVQLQFLERIHALLACECCTNNASTSTTDDTDFRQECWELVLQRLPVRPMLQNEDKKLRQRILDITFHAIAHYHCQGRGLETTRFTALLRGLQTSLLSNQRLAGAADVLVRELRTSSTSLATNTSIPDSAANATTELLERADGFNR